MFDAFKLTRNVIKQKFIYIAYGREPVSWDIGKGVAWNVLIFASDNSFSQKKKKKKKKKKNPENSNNYFLILGGKSSDDINYKVGEPKKVQH